MALISITPLKAIIFSGGYTSVTSLKYACGASQAVCDNFWHDGAKSWNGNSTKVKITNNQTKGQYGDTASVVLLSGTTQTKHLFGIIYSYKVVLVSAHWMLKVAKDGVE